MTYQICTASAVAEERPIGIDEMRRQADESDAIRIVDEWTRSERERSAAVHQEDTPSGWRLAPQPSERLGTGTLLNLY